MADSREYPNRPIVGVGVVVIRQDCVLLIQRGQEPRIGLWSLPGGVVELGENLLDAAAREVREECGVDIKVERFVEAIDLIQRDAVGSIQYHYVIIDFASRYLAGETHAGSDVVAAHWVQMADLEKYALTAQTIDVIKKAFAV